MFDDSTYGVHYNCVKLLLNRISRVKISNQSWNEMARRIEERERGMYNSRKKYSVNMSFHVLAAVPLCSPFKYISTVFMAYKFNNHMFAARSSDIVYGTQRAICCYKSFTLFQQTYYYVSAQFLILLNYFPITTFNSKVEFTQKNAERLERECYIVDFLFAITKSSNSNPSPLNWLSRFTKYGKVRHKISSIMCHPPQQLLNQIKNRDTWIYSPIHK